MYAQLFRRCAELECESQAQPPRILSRAFKFIVKWESEYFESAGKFIDGIIQLHSLVAASIARAYLDPSVGGVITGMFDKRPHTELGNWMDEFRAAKAAFDNQIQLFAKGRSFNIAGRIPPLLLPSIGRLYDTSVHDILEELQKTRNRKFAHAGTLSDQEKEAVMLATKENVLRYLRLTSPFWSCLDLAMVCAVKPSSDLNGKGCNLELKCVCSDDHVVKSFFCPGGDAGEFKEGTIVVVSFEMSFGPVPLLPLYFLKKRSVPDSEHIYFLSNKAKDGNYFEFNSYTGAPEGILKIAEEDPAIAEFIESLKQLRNRKVTADFVVTLEGDRYIPCFVYGPNYAVLGESDIPSVYMFLINQGKPLQFKAERFKPIPQEVFLEAVPEGMWHSGEGGIGLLSKQFYDSGRDFTFFLGKSRVHSTRCHLELG